MGENASTELYEPDLDDSEKNMSSRRATLSTFGDKGNVELKPKWGRASLSFRKEALCG